MSQPSGAYKGLISARSRRLRLTGILVLVAVLGMVVYGRVSLMPSVQAAVRSSAPDVAAARRARAVGRPLPRADEQRIFRRRRAVEVFVVFAYAYWSACSVLVLVALVLAWLDTREVARNYAAARLSLWGDETGRTRGNDGN